MTCLLCWLSIDCTLLTDQDTYVAIYFLERLRIPSPQFTRYFRCLLFTSRHSGTSCFEIHKFPGQSKSICNILAVILNCIRSRRSTSKVLGRVKSKICCHFSTSTLINDGRTFWHPIYVSNRSTWKLFILDKNICTLLCNCVQIICLKNSRLNFYQRLFSLVTRYQIITIKPSN